MTNEQLSTKSKEEFIQAVIDHLLFQNPPPRFPIKSQLRTFAEEMWDKMNNDPDGFDDWWEDQQGSVDWLIFLLPNNATTSFERALFMLLRGQKLNATLTDSGRGMGSRKRRGSS